MTLAMSDAQTSVERLRGPHGGLITYFCEFPIDCLYRPLRVFMSMHGVSSNDDIRVMASEFIEAKCRRALASDFDLGRKLREWTTAPQDHPVRVRWIWPRDVPDLIADGNHRVAKAVIREMRVIPVILEHRDDLDLSQFTGLNAHMEAQIAYKKENS